MRTDGDKGLIQDECCRDSTIVTGKTRVGLLRYPREYDNTQLEISDLFRRHKQTSIIWAHCGLGRVVHPIHDQLRLLETALADPETQHVNIDISWDEVAKYIIATPEGIKAMAAVINKYPDRFLFGTDEVAPPSQEKYLKVYNMYAPLLAELTPEARTKLLKGNYERLFDAARVKVRAWEKAHVNEPKVTPEPTPSSGVAK